MSLGLEAQHCAKPLITRVASRWRVAVNLPPGQLLALFGPNGAGKSTTIGMVCGLIAPRCRFGGHPAAKPVAHDRHAYQRRIGLVPQEIALFEDLPAQANVELFGALYGLSRAQQCAARAEVLARVGLLDRARPTSRRPSVGGMKRRLNIACALVHGPEVLLLDEPTAGRGPCRAATPSLRPWNGLKR